MRLQCGVVAIILVGLLCLGGGFAIGKMTQPITIINKSESHSYSSSDSISVSGTITVNNDGTFGIVSIDMDQITNIMVTTVSNGVTNKSTNYIQAGKKTMRFKPETRDTVIK